MEKGERFVIRKQFRFYGKVQWCGFRYTIQQTILRRYALTGWVENMEDGSVILTVQGKNKEIIMLVHEILQNPRFTVTELETDELPIKPGEKSFVIRQ